jgi:hypothetical protein
MAVYLVALDQNLQAISLLDGGVIIGLGSFIWTTPTPY